MAFENEVPSQLPVTITTQFLRRLLLEIQRLFEAGDGDDLVKLKVEQMMDTLIRCEEFFPASTSLMEILTRVLTLLHQDQERNTDGFHHPIIHSGTRGRPKLEISKEDLEFFIQFGFNTTQIAQMFSVSQRTIQRRLASFGIRENIPRYTDITEVELDETIKQIMREFPNCGMKRMQGFLLQREIRVQSMRLRESMRRVNPIGVTLRSLQLNIVHRRSYSVPGPLSLWHIDGNHKLIR